MTSTQPVRRSNSVLIVDQSDESREVIRTILEPQGVNIIEASGIDRGLELLREAHPDVIVLDLEVNGADELGVHAKFATEAEHSDASLVMLGKLKRVDGTCERDESLNRRHVIAKPYHYGPLIRTIEQLLQDSKAAA